ncbi:MAG TPA: hypothetical protein VGH13_17790 [Xanthobacteraceae bacterium]
MTLEPLFQIHNAQIYKNSRHKDRLEITPWIRTAIADEEQRPTTQLWKQEPSAEFQYKRRLKLIRFCRKHGKDDLRINAIADQLELCEQYTRCCSGACPECGRLIQRWFVRKSKRIIRDVIDKADYQLVAITIIPAKPIIRLGELHGFNIDNALRRLRYALDKAGIAIAIGGVDFSYNEDRDGNYKPFWCPHYYIIAAVKDRKRIRRLIKEIFQPDRRIPRPVKISTFNNSSRRRSYAYKTTFVRRVGIDTDKINKDGTTRSCRDTSTQRLRAAERLELFTYLDRVGFAGRFIFRSIKPNPGSMKVTIQKI